ncbi:hypothetical protein PNA2_0107 [Pyrococcus sp. NA2]|uniref:hypothetical protein n=1 Tax=Pyrococcus sp. (strain NA2) TaxID=342949 RepID=UPI000209AE49|nr:hypothetical protein [Pyrococcus sp. NA2]AEC51025.1 hypothetical protein PNA2_0107 [Pyrococcus sp. NA2]
MSPGFSIVNVEQLRDDLKKWKIKEAIETLQLVEDKVQVISTLLKDRDRVVVENTLFALGKLTEDKSLSVREIEDLLDDIIRLTKSANEKIALSSMKCLRTILENVTLPDSAYDKVINALTSTMTSKSTILQEYAAENLGILGAKIVNLVKKIVNILFSIIRESKDKHVKAAALSALTEIASRSEDKEIVMNITEGIKEFLNVEQDSELRKKAISSLEVILSKKGDKIESETLEEIQNEISTLPTMKFEEIDEGEIERLFEQEKHELVAEIAKENENVLKILINMLRGKDPIKIADALFVISKIIGNIETPKVEETLRILENLSHARNPWIRNTSIKAIAKIYVLHPEMREEIIRMLDKLLRSQNARDFELGLEIVKEILAYGQEEELFKATVIMTLKRINDKELRQKILGFYASLAEHFLNIEKEIVKVVVEKLHEVYKTATQKERAIISSLIDLLSTILEKEGENYGNL